VVLNGEDHLRELRDTVAEALRELPAGGPTPTSARLRLPEGAELLSAEFRSVIRHDFTGELLIPGPGPVEDYVRSMIITQDLADPEALVSAVSRLVRQAREPFRVRTHCGCLICS
jgi:hypothetical protein